jgi:diaminohydroxyphosphoribosylaminopyrimidine deaminase/5-amino-6-(5-phosphoribosylamino)uracil reductase
VDRIVWFVAPSVLGGDGVAAVGALGIGRASEARRLVDVEVERAGDDVVVTGSPAPATGRRPFASAWPPR